MFSQEKVTKFKDDLKNPIILAIYLTALIGFIVYFVGKLLSSSLTETIGLMIFTLLMFFSAIEVWKYSRKNSVVIFFIWLLAFVGLFLLELLFYSRI